MDNSKRYLSTLKSKISKINIKSFDIETQHRKTKTGIANDFLLGGYYSNDKVYFFTDKWKMINFMMSDYEKGDVIYATNLQFDFMALFWKTVPFDDISMIMKNGYMLSAKYSYLSFADSGNYASHNLSVEKMGDIIGRHKKRKPLFLGKKPKNAYQWRKLKDYNAVDCRITAEFVQNLQENFNKLGAKMKLTIASTALDLYRRKYQPFGIWHEHDDVKSFIFKSYYGGRTEVFKRGLLNKARIRDNRKIYHYYDFNSLYPACMMKAYPLPNSCEKSDNRLDFIKKYDGISTVKVLSPQHIKYPILPVRKDGKLIFPIGRFTGTYTHAELSYAISKGYIVEKIFEQIIYKKRFYPFKKYVTAMYNLRKKYKLEGNDFAQMTVKLLMNSLYGKFGSKSIEDFSLHSISGELKRLGRKDFDKAYIGYQPDFDNDLMFNNKNKRVEQNYVIPILASYTTAYGRIELHKALENHNAIYCDTDSIITLDKFPGSLKLGELKLENVIYGGYIVKPKFYMLQAEHHKIFKAKGIKGLDELKFNQMLEGNPVKQQRFMKIKGALRLKLLPNEIIEYSKFMDLEDDKRYWQKPFSLNELQDSEPIVLKDFESEDDEHEHF